MFSIICNNCKNDIVLKPCDDTELDEEREGYYCSSAGFKIRLWQEHDVVGLACGICKACVYTYV